MINGKVLRPDNPALTGGLIQRFLGPGLQTERGFKILHLGLVREKNREVCQMLELHRHLICLLTNKGLVIIAVTIFSRCVVAVIF